MITYIALLRGINVGGHKLIKMQELKALFSSLQYENVRTYIQSGNVVFESGETSAGQLAEAISRGIEETFGFEVPVIIRTLEELEAAIAGNPFPLTQPEEFKRLYVSFLETEPAAEALEKIRPYEDGADKLCVHGKEMYTLYEVSVSESPLFKVPLDKLLGTTLTARNWNTLNKVAALARKP
ncbi:DUF1697 domain-containing protein [Paenibacillus sp. MMS20-IR301]|uniref:DUF1697 domain-containing protein n=1 Tax=Paenibacillus sp. MMS20-IR301 TaxID=2895946 RepID=UPI0028E619EF|nr:DUF1697 domain-containing protein [Paenibacillus sp. MMS20-IR301]WNS41684.1 DUF1697 domain-containing protein [Paenibacillus sp. MMS20-IR301]